MYCDSKKINCEEIDCGMQKTSMWKKKSNVLMFSI